MQSPISQGLGPTIISVSLVSVVLAYVAVILRFWSRHALKRELFAHDVLILLGLIIATGFEVLLIVTVQFGGLGQHAADLAQRPDYLQRLIVLGKSVVAVSCIWSSAMTCIRISILNLYMHIFSMHPRFRISCYAIMGAAGAWWLADILIAFLICRPFAFNWNATIPGGTCSGAGTAYLAIHSFNVAIDMSIAVLPAPVLWKLQMKKGRKIAVIFMFALGALICAISFARLGIYKSLDLQSPEFTYDAATLYLFTILEPTLAIILASIPLLRPAGEKIANSSAVSWMKSVSSSIASSRNASKYSTDKGKSGATSIDEVPLQSRAPNAKYERLGDSSKNIHVTSEVEQRYDSQSQVSRGSGDMV